jgi:transcriptional regulator with XRE-family HTH domain
MPTEFAERLRKIREEKGLTQAELAQRSGLQPSAIAHFEAGRRSPSLDNLRRLADALSVTLDYLLGREPDPKSAGPAAEKLLREFARVPAKDQDTVVDFTKMMADKSKKPKGGK